MKRSTETIITFGVVAFGLGLGGWGTYRVYHQNHVSDATPQTSSIVYFTGDHCPPVPYFAGDLLCPWDDKPSSASFLDTIPEKGKVALKGLRVGMTRAECENKGWVVGLDFPVPICLMRLFRCALPNPHIGDHAGAHLAVEVVWRPTAMPEQIYFNPKEREAWIQKRNLRPTPTDVLMRLSNPFAESEQRRLD